MFAALCGDPTKGVAPDPGCNNDYGFSSFTVDTNQISASYVSATGSFQDSYQVKANSADFSIYGNPASEGRGVVGGAGAYTNLGTLSLNSFGQFSGSVGLTTGSVSGGTCSANCPTVSLNPTSVTLSGGTTTSSTLTVTTTVSTPCANPQQSASTTPYTILVTATSGPNVHTFTITIYVYGHADITKDGVVNIVELALVGGEYGQVSGNPRYNPNVDVSNDGQIDIVDLSTVGAAYGGTC